MLWKSVAAAESVAGWLGNLSEHEMTAFSAVDCGLMALQQDRLTAVNRAAKMAFPRDWLNDFS